VNSESCRNCAGNLILKDKDVCHFPVISLGPNVGSVVCRDELGGDADTSAGSPHAAFDDVLDIQCAGDLPDVLVLSLEGEGGSSRNDFQFRHVRQSIDQLFCEAVGEVFVLRITAHIYECQHSD
jgi:hypothetical protein